MTPIKNNQKPQNPVLSFRVPPEIARQLDELCKRYGMDRTQVLMMLITKEYANTQQIEKITEDKMNEKFYAAYNRFGLHQVLGDSNVQVFRFDTREQLDKFLADHPASVAMNERYAVEITHEYYLKVLEEDANSK